MRQFTNKEIALCHQIAESEKRNVERGDWIMANSGPRLVDDKYWYFDKTTKKLWRSNGIENWEFTGVWFPLWQEHDCKKFLIKKGMRSYIEETDLKKKAVILRVNFPEKLMPAIIEEKSELCWLKAILRILKEK